MKTEKQYLFLKELCSKNKYVYDNFEIKSDFINTKTKILVSNKYGDLLVNSFDLLYGKIPRIESAVDKTEYFSNMLVCKFPNVYTKIKIIGEYVDLETKIMLENKYGLCAMRPQDLLCGSLPTIKSAINKTEYWINMAKETHGDRYDYSLVNYKNNKEEVYIICKIHGIFKQKPYQHIRSNGCSACSYEKHNGYYNVNRALKNKDEYKQIKTSVYIVRLYNKDEDFYKIGIARDLNARMKAFVYNCEVIDIIKTNLYDAIFLEHELHLKNRKNKYEPKIKFGGHTECFKTIEEKTKEE